MASSLSDTESLDTLGLAPSSPYTASLQPLGRLGQESPKVALLAPDALMEQFERAQQYVARHPEDFSLERLSSLQASLGLQRCSLQFMRLCLASASSEV